jgi:hypothetical protein
MGVALMEFWEGAVLLVGGIWLVGRVHRNQVRTAGIAAPVAMPSYRVPGATSETNTDGSGYLVGGESLATGTGTQPLRTGSCPTCNTGLPISAIPRSDARSYVQRPMAVQF